MDNNILASEKLEKIINEIVDCGFGKNDKFTHPQPRQRYVDFNQGVDARLFTEKKVELMSKINVRPLRIAFDDMKTQPQYEKAIRMSAVAGMRDFSNYLLYNFKDKPIDLYRRLKINVDLCEDLQISIYSFPMKYHPIIKQAGDTIDYSHNRDFIGEHWNRKYIRAVQAILNSTKGKIGCGKTFFYKAFGHTEEEFFDLLEMPETFILYRYFFESLKDKYEHSTDNWRACWNDCMLKLDGTEKAKIIKAIHDNDFSETVKEQFANPQSRQLIEFYPELEF